jgi:hypothetical protein
MLTGVNRLPATCARYAVNSREKPPLKARLPHKRHRKETHVTDSPEAP